MRPTLPLALRYQVVRFCPWYPLADAADARARGRGRAAAAGRRRAARLPARQERDGPLRARAPTCARRRSRSRRAPRARDCVPAPRARARRGDVDLAAFYAKVLATSSCGGSVRAVRSTYAMKLVEAESTGPVEGDDAIVTPPRPPHRRVSVSLLFTLSVLIGTVVAIYHGVSGAPQRARDRGDRAPSRAAAAWDLAAPTAGASCARGRSASSARTSPLPAASAIGARRAKLEVLDRHAALIRFTIGNDEVTLPRAAHAAGSRPSTPSDRDGDLRAVAWAARPVRVRRGRPRCDARRRGCRSSARAESLGRDGHARDVGTAERRSRAGATSAATRTHTRFARVPVSVNAPGTTTRLPHATCAGASG